MITSTCETINVKKSTKSKRDPTYRLMEARCAMGREKVCIIVPSQSPAAIPHMAGTYEGQLMSRKY